MLALLYLPLLLLVAGALLAAQLPSWGSALGLFLGWLYLLPPLLCRLLLWRYGPPLTRGADPQERPFRLWWLLTQLQMPFNRIGLLEELLKLLPGLYPLWLNLWGARVSLFSFWGREVMVTERYLLEVGRGAVLASYSGLVGHLLVQTAAGQRQLIVAPVVVEAGALVGIRAGLGPGCRLFQQEQLPAGRLLPPFTGWRAGHKVAL